VKTMNDGVKDLASFHAGARVMRSNLETLARSALAKGWTAEGLVALLFDRPEFERAESAPAAGSEREKLLKLIEGMKAMPWSSVRGWIPRLEAALAAVPASGAAEPLGVCDGERGLQHEHNTCEEGRPCENWRPAASGAAESAPAAPDLTEKQVMDIHRIIERHSTDVIDYEGATDDINAYLFGGIKQPESAPAAGSEPIGYAVTFTPAPSEGKTGKD
jgi:hypothetical protein